MPIEKYQEYLAAQVLNEDRVVNYRLLSRAQKVHVNTAKQMLYEFHRAQNARKPESIHATYLITGVQRPQSLVTTNGYAHQDGDDSFMKDSFTMSSSMPESTHSDAASSHSTPCTTFTLVPQELLEKIRSTYETIHSIHVYSLESGPLANIEVIADCNRRVRKEFDLEDSIPESRKAFGSIHNPLAKRRPRKIPPPVPMQDNQSAPKAATTKPSAPAAQPSAGKPAPTSKPPTLKKESSSLFKSFSKTKPPTKKPDADSPMRGLENDDEEDSGEVPTEQQSKESKEQAEAKRKEREARQDELKKMMEDDADQVDEEMQDRLPGEESDPSDEEEKEADEAPPPVEPPKEEEEEEERPQEEKTTVSDGRRRGRRRVMKKKTFKDAEGYFVTKEEPVWESFSESEHEPAPKKSKPSAPALATTKSAPAAKKGGKPGQGSIMNFFGKK